MAFEISSAVKAPDVNSYSVDRISASTPESKTEVKAEGAGEGIAASSSYQVSAPEKRPEDAAFGNPSEQEKKEAPTEKEVKSKIDQANQELKTAKTGLNFKYHEATKRVSITVYNKDTKEVIREIPPEKSLDMLEKMWELAGMVIDDRR